MKKLLAFFLIIVALAMMVSPIGAVAVNGYNYPHHYIKANASRYVEYQSKNPNLPFDQVVAFVNANVDFGYYNNILTVENPDCVRVLLNKNFALPKGFVPSNLTSVGGNHRMNPDFAFVVPD